MSFKKKKKKTAGGGRRSGISPRISYLPTSSRSWHNLHSSKREGEGDSRHPSESYPLSTGTISYSAYFWVKTSLPVHRSLRIDRAEPHTVGNGHFLGCVVSSSGDDYMPRRNPGSHSLRKTFGRSGRSPSVVSSDDETVMTRPTCHFCGQN